MLDVVEPTKESIGIEVPLEILHLNPYLVILGSLKHHGNLIFDFVGSSTSELWDSQVDHI